ncbi:MAG: ThiS family protein [Promethearchaeota archaeon]|nr:MAG: ThiS family protein [Candidatus Lokiarchaeota archaeon]
MISLQLNYEPPFNELTGKLREEVQFEKNNLTLNRLLNHLYEKYGNEFKELIWDKKKKNELSSFLSIIVNGDNYRDDKFLDKQLKDGDDISFLYIYFGG